MRMDRSPPEHPLLLFVLNDAPFFVSHRLPIAVAALEQGYEVHLAAPAPCPEQVIAAGIHFHPLDMSRSGARPLAEFRTFVQLARLFRRLRPTIVHAVTVKPVIYGGIAARLTGVPHFAAAISGLGTIFVAGGTVAAIRRELAMLLYRLALRHRHLRVIFQNAEDRRSFVSSGIVSLEKTCIFRGSGIDLSEYPPVPEPEGPTVFTFASRLLRDKGVFEFVEAARLLKVKRVAADFWLVGSPDPANPASLGSADLDAIESAGHVKIIGYRSDIAALLGQSHVVVLPSYREGLPRVLAEAAAAGRAVITTDVPGCRDAIIPDQTGLLVPPRDAGQLALAMERMVADARLRRRMGAAGRRLAESDYAIQLITAAHMDIYQELLAGVPEHRQQEKS